jgi:hypothetical protein
MIALPLILTGCSVSTDSSAQNEVILGCSLFQMHYKADKFIMTDLAMTHFNKAAQNDPGYIPLAQAAEILRTPYSDADWQQIGIKEWKMASSLVQGVCGEISVN